LKFLSIIIPVYNNSDVLKNNLLYLKNYLTKKEFDYEIIIVDDGSKDGNNVEKISKQYNCNYFRIPNNRGKGFAIKTGMLNVTGTYRLFTDADIPYESENFDDIIHNLDEEKCQVVIGNRTLNKSSYFKDISFLRSLGSKFFSFLVGGITSEKFADTQCGLKGFTAEAAEEIFTRTKINGFAIDVELIYLAVKKNLIINQIPVNLRTQGISTVKILKHGFLMLVDLIKIKIYQIREKYD
jgi:dolichyl-phosphate beta-glucosyltransferase